MKIPGGKVLKKKEILLHMIGEMAHFILDTNPSRMVISLHQEEDGIHLCVIDDKPRTDKEIQKIRESLNCVRRPELAGYYGIMAGQEMIGAARLNLIGWHVKHADVNRVDKKRENSGIKIDLWLGGENFKSDNFTIPDDLDD